MTGHISDPSFTHGRITSEVQWLILLPEPRLPTARRLAHMIRGLGLIDLACSQRARLLAGSAHFLFERDLGAATVGPQF